MVRTGHITTALYAIRNSTCICYVVCGLIGAASESDRQASGFDRPLIMPIISDAYYRRVHRSWIRHRTKFFIYLYGCVAGENISTLILKNFCLYIVCILHITDRECLCKFTFFRIRLKKWKLGRDLLHSLNITTDALLCLHILYIFMRYTHSLHFCILTLT